MFKSYSYLQPNKQKTKNMKKLFFYIQVSLIMVSMSTQGQNTNNTQKSCLFEEAREELYKSDPNARKRDEEFEKVVRQLVKSKNAPSSKAGESYVVPVVFHVYGKDFPPVGGVPRVVNDEVIRQALKAVNDNFKGFNDAVDSKFANLEAGMNVVFKLAQIDPNGNTTTGIVYHENKVGFGLNSSEVEIAKYAWDNYKYMNVHIQLNIKTLESDTQSGIAWFPNSSMSDEGVARVVYNGRYIIYSPPASSLTHEFGHFFGLEHTFEGGCVAGADLGDLVADTPPTTSAINDCNFERKNCFNNFINIQNHMDYNPCETMFTKGQVTRMESFMTHPARKTLWQDANLTATGIKNNLGPRIVFNFQDVQDNDIYKYTALIEDFDNTGKITGRRKIKAVDGAKFAKTGLLTLNTDFRIENLPSGITARINVINDTTADLFFEGSASSHNGANSGTIKLTLLNPSIVGGVATIFSSTATYKYQFSDPYTTSYDNFSPDIMMGYGETSQSVPYDTEINSSLIGGKLVIGLNNFDGNKIVLDNSNSKIQVLCLPNTSNAAYFPANTQISSSTTGLWKLADCDILCPQPIITSPEHTAWHGKTGFIAIRVPTINNSFVYGWIKATVRADGQVVTLSSAALNLSFGQSITTSIAVPHLSYSNGRFLEAPANNGTIENEITLTLSGTTFVKTGVLTSGTHYNFSNTPAGHNVIVTVTNSTTAKIKLDGVGANSNWNFYNNLEFKLLNAAVTSGNASAILFSTNRFGVEYTGEVITQTTTAKINRNELDFAGQIDFLSSSYNLDSRSNQFSFQDYTVVGVKPFGLKYISYRKDAIADANFNLTPLDEGAVIGPNSAWKRGREYFTENGQHTIDDPNYTSWRGKTKYAGIRIRRSGRLYYGWAKIRASSDGKIWEQLEFALNNIPDKEIIAGRLPAVTAYCTGNANPTNFNISNVKIGTINNSTTTIEANGYSNFTNLVANMNLGSTQTISVTNTYNNNTVANNTHAWIDWNQNLVFEANEKVLSKNIGVTVSNSFTVPTTAKTGKTRMRIRYSLGVDFGSCGYDERLGEVEDYTVNVIGTTTPTTSYCAATSTVNNFYITNVTLGTINNSTSTIESNGYSDFTNQVVSLAKGSSQTVSVTSNYNNSTVPNHYNVWIDWNQNKTFEASEKVLSKTSGVTVINTFTVPTTAVNGNTRMRVRYSFENALDACGFDSRFGEVEDYTVNISGTTVSNGTLTTPGGIFASSISATGFLARFDRPVAPTVIEVQILEGGSWITLGTATINNFRINKRGSALNYNFRVRAVKGTETSNWTTPFDVVLPNSKIGLDQVAFEEQFRIYPNPSTDEVFFSLPEGINSSILIEMYDISGRLVEKLMNVKSYNVSKLPKGIYQVKLFASEYEYVISKPMIVQ
jgi:hypothetical protein